MIERVRGLLRMAEDPAVTDAESQAFTAKAAELMTRHAIAEAEARAQRGEAAESVTRLDFPVSGVGGHGKARVKALAAIASAYGCQSAVRGNTSANTDRTLIIVGTVTALDSLRVLLPSITMQMEASARYTAREHVANLRALRNYDRSALATERSRFYRSFVRAYGYAVAERIREFRARLRETSEQAATGGGTEEAAARRGAELVLRDDVDRVQDEFQRRFPQLRPTRPERTHHRAGYRAGYLRGRRAELGMETAVGKGGTASLTDAD
ncbi:DUF2786 domain-containing protein [Marinitenerispora sediminis]|uniref:DUF2786 domain-containing protein n=1 Tax=Marinitenerispora sediminis TaxID=1931232 RepID=A0A368T1Y6_9ACTN|nr:hypothetical protein DEF28_22350 [Marinitenerispora sediminis]RCV51338.1 hypothetical protein DEF23_20635 [Marinitenerispora sediminis]RCV54925.1 hypothetical protein DEF24_18655 [Marinitenerispora sediminis]